MKTPGGHPGFLVDMVCCKQDGGYHAFRVCFVLPGNIKRGAVCGGRAQKRKSRSNMHGGFLGSQLQAQERLIVIHTQHAVVLIVQMRQPRSVGG